MIVANNQPGITRGGNKAVFQFMDYLDYEFDGTPPAWYVTGIWLLKDLTFRIYHYGPYATEQDAQAAYATTQLDPPTVPHPGISFNKGVRTKLAYTISV